MADPIAEFMVDGITPLGGGRVRADGRCGDVPIRVRDEFDAIYRVKRPLFLDEYDRPSVRECEQPASIRVEKINAYERDLELLGRGVTGSLVISGEGAGQITCGWVIGFRSDPAARSAEGHPGVDQVRYKVSDGTFTLRLEPEPAGGYRVTSPMDPGFIARVSSLEEAFAKAREAGKRPTGAWGQMVGPR